MPRSLDPSRAALLNKPKSGGLGLGPRVSISVDDITAQNWSVGLRNNGGALYPLPNFYLQPPSPNGSSRSVKVSGSNTSNVVVSSSPEPDLRYNRFL